jgi:hypothetical protein
VEFRRIAPNPEELSPLAGDAGFIGERSFLSSFVPRDMVQKRVGPIHVALSISSLLNVHLLGVCRFSNGMGRVAPRMHHLRIHAREA